MAGEGRLDVQGKQTSVERMNRKVMLIHGQVRQLSSFSRWEIPRSVEMYQSLLVHERVELGVLLSIEIVILTITDSPMRVLTW